MPDSVPGTAPKKRLVKILKIVLTAALLAYVYHKIDLAALRGQLSHLRTGWPWCVAFLALLGLNTLVSSVKWAALLRADGIDLPVRKLFASHLIGSFFNLFLPSSIGGDVYRIADVGRRSSRTANAAASILFDRLTGFLAIALYGIVFYLLSARAGWIHPTLPDCLSGGAAGEARIRGLLYAALPLAAFLALAALLLLLLQERLVRAALRLVPGKLRPKCEAVADKVLGSVQTYVHAPSAWIPCIFLSFWFQANAILAVYTLSRALDLGLPLFPFWFFIPFITLLEMIPISIFGLGLRDFGYKAFFLSAGVATLASEEQATAAAASLAVLYVALTIAYVSIGGVLYLARQAEP